MTITLRPNQLIKETCVDKKVNDYLDTSKKDRLFRSEVMSSFKFDSAVAAVFDDMVSRSVPIYAEIHQVILDLVGKRKWNKESKIVDIGCSTATTLFILHHYFKREHQNNVQLVGLDPSAQMLDKAREKASALKDVKLDLKEQGAADFNESNVDMVIMNYTLQFIPIEERLELLKKIHNSLKPGGLFILAEKVKSRSPSIQGMITDLYYDFKRRNGYEELEISRKREALENVLIPLDQHEQMQMLKESGFLESEMIFRWYNFACYVGVK